MDDTVQEENIFAEEQAEDLPESSQENTEVEETEQTSEEETTDSTQEPFLTIRYDKEDIPLTQEEAIALAQKGKNYDRLSEKYNNLNNELEMMARANGMDINTYLSNLSKIQTSMVARKELEKLKGKYPDADEGLLLELANKQAEEVLQTRRQEYVASRDNQANSQKEALKAQLTRFEKRYPKVDASKLDAKVYDLMKEGYTLLEAYEEIEHEKALSQDRVNKKNEANKNRSLGSTSNAAEADESNAFLQGLLEGD